MALINCRECGKEISDQASSCPNCGCPNKENQIEESPKEDLMKCPRCGSTQLTSNKKGYGVGKAAVGVILTGGIGLVAGGIGSSKVKITCLKCGFQFKAGEYEKKLEQEKEVKRIEANQKEYNSFKNTDPSTWTENQQKIAKEVKNNKTIMVVVQIIAVAFIAFILTRC